MAQNSGTTTPSPLMTPGEAAAAVGVTPDTLIRWQARGALHPIELPSGHRRYKRAEIDMIRQALAS